MRNRILTLFIVLLSSLPLFTAKGQGLENYFEDDGHLYDPFRTVYKAKEVEFVDRNSKNTSGSIINMHVLLKQDMMNPLPAGKGGMTSRTITKNTQRGGVSAGNDNSTVRTSAPRGRSVSDRNRDSRKAQVDRQVNFNRQQQEIRREQARIAAEKAARKRAEERRRDNERVAAATAAAHARLQGRTNENVRRDYYNAGEGRTRAKETARQTVQAMKVGPQRVERQQPRTSGQSYSASLRQATQRDRKRRPQASRQVAVKTARRMVPDANRMYSVPARATRTSIHIKADTRRPANGKTYQAPRTIRGNRGFVLDPNAVVTTGRPIAAAGPRTRPEVKQIPEPVTRLNVRSLSHKELMDLKIKEFLQ